VFSWNVLNAGHPNEQWDIQLEANTPQSGGWVGFGWSNDGTMHYGDYVIGWAGCVVVRSMDGGTPPPKGKPGFEITDTAYSSENGKTTIRFKRPYGTVLPGHPSICTQNQPDCHPAGHVYWLFASGSSVPSSCEADFTQSNFHDRFYGHFDSASALHNTSVSAPAAPAAPGYGHGSPPGTSEPLTMSEKLERHTPISFVEAATHTRQHKAGFTVHSTTYVSKPIPLIPGQIAWTYPELTPVPMPGTPNATYPNGRRWALLGYHDAEVVDCHEQSVPLSKVYNHHWILNPVPGENNAACPQAGFTFVVGVGAESRRTPWAFPEIHGEQHGLIFDQGTTWFANIHLLKTVDLVDGLQGSKACVECWYSPEKACQPGDNGTFGCCFSNSRCATLPNASTVPEVYYLKYTVEYTFDVDLITPTKFEVFMSPNCQVAYNALPPGAAQAGASVPSLAPPGPEHLVSNNWTMDGDTDIVFAVGHLHTGAINVSLSINGDFKCVSEAIYGTEPDVAGNELGHLIGMTNCVGGATNKPVISVKKGDTLTLNGWYWVGPTDPRIAPVPAGPHLVIMSYMFVLYKEGGSGWPPPAPPPPPSTPAGTPPIITVSGAVKNVVGFSPSSDERGG